MWTGKRKFKKHSESPQKKVYFSYSHMVALGAVGCYLLSTFTWNPWWLTH